MVARITNKELSLRSELSEFREFMRDRPAKIARVPPFKNLVANGGFDSDTAWIKGAGWSIGSGIASRGNTDNNNDLSQANLRIDVNRKYGVTFTISVALGGVTLRLGVAASAGNVGSQISSSGTYSSFTAPLGSHGILQFLPSTTFEGSLDDVSLWEVDPSDNARWLRLPFGHTVGKQGRIYRDGGYVMSSDYEEITIAGQSWIKPLVAPGVNTEFDVYCGIGA